MNKQAGTLAQLQQI